MPQIHALKRHNIGGPASHLNIRLSDEDLADLRIVAAQKQVTLGTVVRQAISNYLAERVQVGWTK